MNKRRDLEDLDTKIVEFDSATEPEKRRMYLELLDNVEPNPCEHLERMVGMLSLVLLLAIVVAVRQSVPTELVWVVLGVVATLAGVPLVERLGMRR